MRDVAQESLRLWDEVERTLTDVDRGNSSVTFTPGRAVIDADDRLQTIAVVLVGIEQATRDAMYSYLFTLQKITHRLRPFLITDGTDLGTIRNFGWLTDHLLSRGSLAELEPQSEWIEMVTDRVKTAVGRLDASHVIVAGPRGLTQQQHEALGSALRIKLPPYEAVAFTPKFHHLTNEGE